MAIKGIISELPEQQKESVNSVAAQIKKLITDAEDPIGQLAFALVALELAEINKSSSKN